MDQSLSYSPLSAAVGSMRIAVSAGIAVARRPAAAVTTATTRKVGGSSGVTPKRSALEDASGERRRAASPIAMPAAVSQAACARIVRATSDRPRAERDAHADLARSLGDAERHHAVDPYEREHTRRRGKRRRGAAMLERRHAQVVSASARRLCTLLMGTVASTRAAASRSDRSRPWAVSAFARRGRRTASTPGRRAGRSRARGPSRDRDDAYRHDTDHFLGGEVSEVRDHQRLADGIDARPQTTGGGFVDDDDRRRSGPIALVEHTSASDAESPSSRSRPASRSGTPPAAPEPADRAGCAAAAR